MTETKIVRCLFTVMAIVFSTSLLNCASVSVTKPDVLTRGTVAYVDLRGGFYGIVTDSGEKLLPINLPLEFQHDQLSVVFRCHVDNKPTYQEWGTPIEIIDIKRL